MKKLVLSAIVALAFFATVAASGKHLTAFSDPPPDCPIIACGASNSGN